MILGFWCFSRAVFHHEGSADTKITKRAAPRRLRRHEGHEVSCTTKASHSRSARDLRFLRSSSRAVFHHEGSADTKATKRASPRRLRIHEAHEDPGFLAILFGGLPPRRLRGHEDHEAFGTTKAFAGTMRTKNLGLVFLEEERLYATLFPGHEDTKQCCGRCERHGKFRKPSPRPRRGHRGDGRVFVSVVRAKPSWSEGSSCLRGGEAFVVIGSARTAASKPGEDFTRRCKPSRPSCRRSHRGAGGAFVSVVGAKPSWLEEFSCPSSQRKPSW